jgi:CBS domain-containing protein
MPSFHDIPGAERDPFDIPVRSIMSPGVLTIGESASLGLAFDAIAAHRVHALLVLATADSRPLGWISVRSLPTHLEGDLRMLPAVDAIDEEPVVVHPGSTAREAMAELTRPGVSHLLVSHHPGWPPEGVVSALDLAALARAH